MLRTKQGKSRNVQVLSWQVGSVVTMVVLWLYIESSSLFFGSRLVSQWLHTAAYRLCVPLAGGANPETNNSVVPLLRVWKFPPKIPKIPQDLEAKYFQTPGTPVQEDLSGWKESFCAPDRSSTTESTCGSSLGDRLSHPLLLINRAQGSRKHSRNSCVTVLTVPQTPVTGT